MIPFRFSFSTYSVIWKEFDPSKISAMSCAILCAAGTSALLPAFATIVSPVKPPSRISVSALENPGTERFFMPLFPLSRNWDC